MSKDTIDHTTAQWLAEQQGDTIYYPIYQIPSTIDHTTAQWLAEQQGDGPLRLIDITDVCATFSVTATLKDVAGNVKGYVFSNGDWKLG